MRLIAQAAPNGRRAEHGRQPLVTTVLRSRLFWVGLALRLAALPFFGSYFSHTLFLPFLDQGVLHPLENPWAALSPEHFPYGTVLYLALLIPKWLAHQWVGAAALGASSLSLVLLKVPLLLFDLLALSQLLHLAPNRQRELMIYYWLNPIVFFISYIHGQLDVAATALCLASLYALVQDRVKSSAILLALAGLCKAHVMLAVPLMLAYLWNRHFVRRALTDIATWLSICVPLTLVGFLPHLSAKTFGYVTTTSPQAARLLAAQIELSPNRLLYVGLAIVTALVGRLCAATRLSQTGLLFGAGVLFGALVAVTGAMPGWYFWFMPYAALFYATYVVAPKLLYVGLCLLYAVNFILMETMLHGMPVVAHGTIFTLLQTCLAGLLVVMWFVAVRSEAPLRGRVRPFLIGIAGDSGAGKNLLASVLADLFEPRATALLEGDDYHKWERGHARWSDYTHLHPKANDLEELAAHTDDLVSGRLIFAPHYDHATGTFTAPRKVHGSKLVIVQGLHAYYLRQMRKHLDLKVFLAPHPLVRLSWKIRRDVQERGHNIDKVLESLRRREADAQAHIDPQKALADWIIEVAPIGDITRADVLAGRPFDMQVRHTLWNDAPVAQLVAALGKAGTSAVTIDSVPGDINRVLLCIVGSPSQTMVEEMARSVFPNLRWLTRGSEPPRYRGGYHGISQLIALALLQSRSENANVYPAPSEPIQLAA